MGKLTLLLVGAAVIGGSLLTFSTRRIASETQDGHREGQADLLSRQISESGHAVVLAAIVGDEGFRTPRISTRTYEGGTYRVEYDPSSTESRTTFEVTGDYRGSTHTVRSTYEFDPMNYPGPIWLDVPYATAIANSADVENGPIQFDRRKHDALALESLAPLGPMSTALRTAASAAGAPLSTPSSGSWNALLEDLNVTDGEGLYQAALAKTPETTLAGPLVVNALARRPPIGAPDEVTRVTGDLTVRGRFEGSGALVIEGELEVLRNGIFTWDGLVIVRAEQQYLPITLDGEVEITGGLVVVQHAYPPGGHMDVTTWRDLTNGLSSRNVSGEAPVAPWTAGFPWHQHKHRFDEDLGTRRVQYLAGGNAVPSQETWTQFEDTIAALGNEKVYIEFENEARHGYGVYTVNVDGMAQPATGLVRDGFGSLSRGAPHQSQSFRANDLRDFEVDIRSLRTLEDRFDGRSGCDSWPFCIGDRWDRGGALRVRLRRHSDNDVLYESALYWHMQPTEWTVYQAQEAAWRAQIQSGGLFGTRLEMGRDTEIAFEIGPVLALVERLGFDGNESIHLGTEADHSTIARNMLLAMNGSGKVEICHNPGTPTERDMKFEPGSVLREHLGHGDHIYTCGSGSPPRSGDS